MTKDGSKTTQRTQLLTAALRLLADGGPETLQARKVTTEAGVSTMAVYTHFGGMRQLIEAVAHEGFAQLDAALDSVTPSDDPVTDTFHGALAYRGYAIANPDLYRLMFGLTAPSGYRLTGKDLTRSARPTKDKFGTAAFAHIVELAGRMMRAGRVRSDDPVRVAAQLWSMLHGYVVLELAGYFGSQDEGIEYILRPLGINLVVGLGDDRAAVERSTSGVQDSRI